MADSFINVAAVLVFIVFQAVAAILVFVIRYHFKRFVIAGDPLARKIVGFMSWGAAAFGTAAFILLLSGIASL